MAGRFSCSMLGLRLVWCTSFDDYATSARQSMATDATAAANGLEILLYLQTVNGDQ